MDVSSTKQTEVPGALPQAAGKDGGAAGAKDISLTFVDLLKTAGVRIESGFNVLTDREGVTTLPDDAERARPAADAERPVGDDGERSETQARETAYREDDRAPPEGSDEDDHGTGETEARDDARGGKHEGYAASDETAPTNDDGHGHAASSEDKPAADAAPHPPADDTAADDPADAGTGTGTDADAAAAATAAADAAPDETSAQHASQVLAGLVAVAEAANPPGEGGGQGRSSAVDGLTTALAAVAKAPPAGGGPQTNTNPHQQGQGQPQAQSQTQANAGQPAQAAAESAAPNTAAAQQAASLSRLLGEGNPLKVQVTVANAPAVSAQPGSTLAAATATAAQSANGAQHGQPPAHGPLAAAVNAAAAAAAAAAAGANAQGQQAAAQTAQAAQAAAAAGPGATAPSATPVNQAAPQAQALGPDGAPASGLSGTGTNTAPTQNTTPAQAANAHRPPTPPQSVADQVSVNITRALKAGVDEINIQLKPANLGRIDVRLEVGHDGRVQAVVTADSKDTLDLLQRDARGLERALQDAGLQTGAGDLSFNLREQGGGSAGDDASAPAVAAAPEAEVGTETPYPALATEWLDGIRPDGRIDIRA